MSSCAKAQDSCSKATIIMACCILMLLTVVSVGVAATEQKPLTNGDIVSMVQAGLPPDVVIEKIKLSKNNAFDTSTDALITLKKAGVSGDVIRVMVNPNAESKPVPGGNDNTPAGCQVPPGGQPPWLSGSSPAMWFVLPDKSERSEINYERGTITHVGFGGFGARLLVLHPKKATARVPNQAQFLSCINPTDAPLVHFSIDAGSDERNTSVGKTTPFHVSFNISEDDLVKFKFEKTPDGYFKITPNAPLQPGEYGFVPQGTLGFFSPGERVYTFGVD
jgi:hypothetical protein